jgi:RimJ/RimL family protein N-acetyltransferase
MLKGEHVGLRAIETSDLPQLLEWRNRPDYRRYFRETRELSASHQDRWFQDIVMDSPSIRMFAIERLSDGRMLGACGLCYINWTNRNSDLSIYIGADDLYIDDLYAPDAARTLIQYGFNELGLHRIWAEIYAIDAPKQKLLSGLGFTLDGRHRENHWTEGGWVDSLFYGLLQGEEKW